MKRPSLPSIKWEFLSPFWMYAVLVYVSAFYNGRAGDLYISARGWQARIVIMLAVYCWMFLYLHEWRKLRYKTYRILLWVIVFMILMFLGCHFIPWWNVWMSIPLTMLWYPIHRWILKGLPRKETDTGDDNSNG